MTCCAATSRCASRRARRVVGHGRSIKPIGSSCARRALPRRPRADVRGRRLHVHEHARSGVQLAAGAARFAISPRSCRSIAYTVDFVLNAAVGLVSDESRRFKIVPAGAGRELAGSSRRHRPVRVRQSYAVDDRLEMRAFRDYFDGLPRNRGIVLKVVPDDIMRGARAAEGDRPISSSTTPARHGRTSSKRKGSRSTTVSRRRTISISASTCAIRS